VFGAFLRSLGKEKAGQDVAEYCMITALVALVGLAIFIHMSGGVQAIWGSANTALVSGSTTQGVPGGSASAAGQGDARTSSGDTR
jgi:Flp pilus assembly pilin Flp